MFRTYAYDLVTMVTVFYADNTVDMFNVLAENEIKWLGSWEQWGKDMVNYIKSHTDYPEKKWDFIRLVLTEKDEEDNAPYIMTIRLYSNSNGNPEIEDIVKQYL